MAFGMSLRRFRYFVAVAAELHVGRAAEHLGIAQPALSQQLRILEETLGVRLLRRVGRGIALTEAGAAFLPEARAVINQSERAIDVARRTARGELGAINIGYVNTAMLEPDLPGLLFAFRASVPDARIRLEEISVQEQIAALEQHRLDIGIIRAPAGPLPSDLRSRPFTRSRLLAVVPPPLAARLPLPVRLTDLADEPFIALRDPDGIGLAHHVSTLCVRAGFTPRLDLRVDNATSIVGLVAAGFGVSVVPAALAQIGLANVTFLELDDQDAHTELLIVHRPADLSPLKQRFLQLATLQRSSHHGGVTSTSIDEK
jgi:DNA-binding transcriptional LysR family regulator